jgi:hypothetical protein
MKKLRLIQLSLLIITPALFATNSVAGDGEKPCCFTSPKGVTTVNPNGPHGHPAQGACATCGARGGNFRNNQPNIKEAPPVPPSRYPNGTTITPVGRPGGGGGASVSGSGNTRGGGGGAVSTTGGGGGCGIMACFDDEADGD